MTWRVASTCLRRAERSNGQPSAVDHSMTSTPGASARSRTSCMTGRPLSAPGSISGLRADDGISSSADGGVCPNRSR